MRTRGSFGSLSRFIFALLFVAVLVGTSSVGAFAEEDDDERISIQSEKEPRIGGPTGRLGNPSDEGDDPPAGDDLGGSLTRVMGKHVGFFVNYDENVWTLDDQSGDGADNLLFYAGGDVLVMTGVIEQMESADCLSMLTKLNQEQEGVSAFEVAPDRLRRPETDATAEGELYTMAMAMDDGTDQDSVVYAECRPVSERGILAITFLGAEATYAEMRPELEAILTAIEDGDRADY